MPLIQRNLFPSRPSSKKFDGPSVLRNNNNNNNYDFNQRTIINPNLSIIKNNNNIDGNKLLKINEQQSSSINNNYYYKNVKGNINNKNKDVKKLRKSHSASMISLMIINNNNNNNNNSSDTSSDPNSSSSSSMDNGNNMMSRRRILSRSRDALNNNINDCININNNSSSNQSTSDEYQQYNNNDENYNDNNNDNIDEDVWHNKTKLITDHIDEIITKWNQIDDEIWAKIICMERNRRIAKAYARTPILTINGFNNGFDGYNIGLNGFSNPIRDKKCDDIIKNKIKDGIKIFMDKNGNLLIKRLTNSNVFILNYDQMDNLLINKINEQKKFIQLFNMKQYHNDLLIELRSKKPNHYRLQRKCFCFISFVSPTNDNNLLDTPVWCIIINLVALEMLIKLLPPPTSSITNKSFIDDDNFYSLPITISMKKNNDQYQSIPPKLPPRDIQNKNPPLTLPEPDYDYDENNDDNVDNMVKSSSITIYNNQRQQQQQQQKQRHLVSYLDDDPYFYGLSAHVPKFYNHQRTIMKNFHQQPPPLPLSSIAHKEIMAKKLWNNVNQFYPNSVNDFLFRSTTIFDPITMIPQPLLTHSRNNDNDNNEIYGINPSLLRKNKKFQKHQQQTNSSSSSSSISSPLRNIFSRKNNKEQINNKSRKR